MASRASEKPLPTTVEGLLNEFQSLESQLQQLRDSLSHSHRLATLGTLAAMLAHEFNNLLTPIISYGQLALARPDDAELMKTAVTRSVHAAERAARICSSLLGFAGDEKGAPTAPLRQTVNESIECLGRDPRKDGLSLTIDLPDVQVAMPAVNLQQVMVNLILNACKAMKPRGGSLRIVGRVQGGQVHIDVADSGPGIPAAIRGQLFEPFVTHPTGPSRGVDVPPLDSRRSRGTGLGLSICRDMLTSAGGSIAFDTEEGQGTTFHLTVPLAVELVEST